MTSFVPANASSSVSEKDIYRIEVSLASRKTTVRVMPTSARVFVLEERYEVPQPGQYGSEQPLPVMHRYEWKLVCTGIPCVLTERREPHPTSPYAVKVAIAEAESGLAIWDCVIEPSSEYRASQANFHTFKSATRLMHGVQFLDMTLAQMTFDLLTDLLSSELHLSRHTSVRWCMEEEAVEKDRGERKKPEFKRRSMSVSKKDISKPCNFIHLAGITNKRTETCEKELTGTMRRMKERSMSLSNLNDEEPQKTTPKMTKRFSFRRSKRKSSKPVSPQVGSPFIAQTRDSQVMPTYDFRSATFNRSRSSSDMPKPRLTERPYSTYSLGFEPSLESDIDTMFKKRLEQKSVPVRASIPEYVLQTNSSAHHTASIGGSSSKTASPTDEPATTSKGTTAPEKQTFSTAAYSRGYNPLPSKFAPLYSSAASLTSEGKPKRRFDANRARVSISDSMSNISESTSFAADEDGEEDSPFFVERYAQQGPETSVETSLVPVLDPDEYCNEVGRRGMHATGAYSYSTYTRNAAKQKDLAHGVLRRPAASNSVSSGPSIPRSASGHYRSVGGAVQPARPASPSNSSHSSSSKKADSQHSDTIDPKQSLADTAQLVSQYTERMSEALHMFDNLVLSELDYGGRAPASNTRLPPAEIAYGTLSSEV